jgi:ATP-binding cassette subfamily E protein 1
MKRIAIVDENKCKPEKCKKECISVCPPQKGGKSVIEIEDIGIPQQITNKKQIAKIIESNCIGCNLCVKKCPFNAIKIVNLPNEIPTEITHRYSTNGFRLYRLPSVKPNMITGILGQNGVGKTTIVNILSNIIKPNFEQLEIEKQNNEIIAKFRGTSLQNYFNKLYNNELVISVKPQKIKNLIKNNQTHLVSEFIASNGCNIIANEWFDKLEINSIIDKQISFLSGGELQRLLCWMTAMKEADVYIFDEPTNFLDIKQRLEISKMIYSLKQTNKYVFVIEHDLSILDYIADEIYILYGNPSVYGIVSKPLSPLEGINNYLDGYIPSENIRFREEKFTLKLTNEISTLQTNDANNILCDYPDHKIEYGTDYELNIPSGYIQQTSLNVILGENGTGKTTFINWLSQLSGFICSIKLQNTDISPYRMNNGKYKTVYTVLYENIGMKINDTTFITDVIKQLNIEMLFEKTLNTLSGGELQRVMIALCLGKEADIYFLDEPSANLDIENRLNVIRTVKKFMNQNKCCFVIEHDIMMSVSFAEEQYSKIILLTQVHHNQKKVCQITRPLHFAEGINAFMQSLNITMRISTHNRPRINKHDSRLDKQQKNNGTYYA